MGNYYDRYLDRLYKKRMESPNYNNAVRNNAQLAQPWNEMKQEFNWAMKREGAPGSMKAQYAIDSQQKWSEQQYRYMSEAQSRDSIRRDQFDSKIEDVQFKKEMYEEQKKEEEKARKKARNSSFVKMGGALLGGAVGSVIPGAGTLIGAQIGSAVGDVASGFGVGNGGEFQSANDVLTGIGDTFAGISSIQTLKSQKALTNTLSNNMGSISKMGSQDLMKLMYMMQTGVQNGDAGMLENFFNQYGNPSAGEM